MCMYTYVHIYIYVYLSQNRIDRFACLPSYLAANRSTNISTPYQLRHMFLFNLFIYQSIYRLFYPTIALYVRRSCSQPTDLFDISISTYLSICVSMCVYIYYIQYLYVYPPTTCNLFICLSVQLSIYQSISLSIHPSIHLYIHVYLYIYIIFIALSFHLSTTYPCLSVQHYFLRQPQLLIAHYDQLLAGRWSMAPIKWSGCSKPSVAPESCETPHDKPAGLVIPSSNPIWQWNMRLIRHGLPYIRRLIIIFTIRLAIWGILHLQPHPNHHVVG